MCMFTNILFFFFFHRDNKKQARPNSIGSDNRSIIMSEIIQFLQLEDRGSHGKKNEVLQVQGTSRREEEEQKLGMKKSKPVC